MAAERSLLDADDPRSVAERFAEYRDEMAAWTLTPKAEQRLERLEDKLLRLEERTPDELTHKEVKLWAKVDALMDSGQADEGGDASAAGGDDAIRLANPDLISIMPIEEWWPSAEQQAIYDQIDAIWAKYAAPEPSAADQDRLDAASARLDAIWEAKQTPELAALEEQRTELWKGLGEQEPTDEQWAAIEALDQQLADLYAPNAEETALWEEIDGIWAGYQPTEPTATDEAQLTQLYDQLAALAPIDPPNCWGPIEGKPVALDDVLGDGGELTAAVQPGGQILLCGNDLFAMLTPEQLAVV